MNTKEFQKLLRKAIGENRSQMQFSKDAGISADHLSRMLNAKELPQPRKSTLVKIAGCAKDVTYPELLAACGYKKKEDTSNDAERREGSLFSPTVDELNKEYMKNVECAAAYIEAFTDGVAKLAAGKGLFAGSMEELMDIIKSMYFPENAVIDIHGEVAYDAQKSRESFSVFPTAELVAPVTITFEDGGTDCVFTAAIYYSKTQKGNLVVEGCGANRYEVTDCWDKDYVPKTISRFAESIVWEENEAYGITFYVRRIIKDKKADERSAAKLLQFLLKAPDPSKKRLVISEGPGIWLDKVPLILQKEFVARHSVTLSEHPHGKEILDAVRESKDPDKELTAENCDIQFFHGHEGIAGLIGYIIAQETGISIFGCVSDKEHNNRACVLFEKKEPWAYSELEKNLTEETLKCLLDNYACELQTEVAECWNAWEMDID